MPKGIYDRNKVKRKAEDTAATPVKTPGKRGRKPKAALLTKVANTEPTPTTGMSDVGLLYEIRANLAVLAQVASEFNSVSVQKEIHANMELLVSLRESITKEYVARQPAPEVVKESTEEVPVRTTIQVPLPPNLQATPPIPQTH